ncbi:hypothetical protein [Flavilitoribacter nigricans]|uniref:Uncharacterized protein n=1 Tax=Flavilitoribacter nigricans (strain ATCC 23147 / DSM 23189 / NBRC 102662 / NCIMB 1420 / SS-2) TaxID=1122177 RepID=A0A2D0MX39_FLAN2|nr:hypothetical protein [Flavilitoribacter nigricans]PHN00767.1 hypothetical protein CRP01_40620 [Flavilitoribacter nigricans DSM 23189 = NBRC 102662]
MPGLNDLQNVTLRGQQAGAYMEPVFFVEGLDQPVGLKELLEYIIANLGGEGGGGADNYVTAANLAGDTLTLSRISGGNVTVDLSSIDTDTNDFVANAALDGGNNLVLTMDSGATVLVDLSSLAGGGGTTISIYDAGLGFMVKGTAGIVVSSGSQGVYDFDIPAGGILESFQKQFTNAGTEFTPGGEVQLNLDWNTAAFNTSFANAVNPNIKLILGNNNQAEPASFSVTVQHTSVAGGVTATSIANINGVGTPVRVKGIL